MMKIEFEENTYFEIEIQTYSREKNKNGVSEPIGGSRFLLSKDEVENELKKYFSKKFNYDMNECWFFLQGIVSKEYWEAEEHNKKYSYGIFKEQEG